MQNLVQLVSAMSLVLLWWMIAVVILIGVGLYFTRHDRTSSALARALSAFWIGLAVTLLVLQAWHLAWPVGNAASAVVGIAGVVGWITRGHLFGSCMRELRGHGLGLVVPIAIGAIWLANRAIGPGDSTDSGLYHYLAVDLARHHPLIPGIANLNVAAGVNSSTFLYFALLSVGPMGDRVEHVGNGLLLLVPLIAAIAALRRTWKTHRIDATDLPWLLLVPFVVYSALGNEVRTPDTDLSAGIVSGVAGWFALRSLVRGESPLPAILVAAAALTAKASVAPAMAVLCLAAAVGRSVRGGERVRGLALAAVILSLASGVWIARNVVTSGLPLYPGAAVKLDVDWRLDQQQIDFYTEAFRMQPRVLLPNWIANVLQKQPGLAWYAPLARTPVTEPSELTAFNWVRGWFFALPATGLVEILLPLGVVVVLLIVRLRAGPISGSTKPALWIVSAALLGLLVWFVAAPDPKYVVGLSYLLMVGVASGTIAGRSITRLQLVVLMTALVVPAIAHRAVLNVALKRGGLSALVYQPPGHDRGFHSTPVIEFVRRPIGGGDIWWTESGPLCWRGPLPRTGWPPMSAGLSYREPGNLRTGFRVVPVPATQPSR